MLRISSLSFTNYFNISTRIILGFTVTLSSLLFLAVFSIWATSASQARFFAFKDINRQANQIAVIDRHIVSLQKYVQVFVYTGYDAIADHVRKESTELKKSLNVMEGMTHSSTRQELLARMRHHFLRYSETFDDALSEYAWRDQAVQKIQSLSKKIGSEGNPELSYFTYQTTSIAYRYLADTNSKRLTQHISQLQNDWLKRPSLSSSTRENLDAYQTALRHLIQSTRGYLYLVNVVMAGESLEFRHVSQELKTQLTKKVSRLSDITIKKGSQARMLGGVLSAITLFVGLVIAILISRSITLPITAITDVLIRLSKGESINHIPGAYRTDEVGAMAEAANIFRERNAETERLLTEVESQREALERSNEELDQFVHTVSHDLKTPVVTSSGFIGMMKDLASKGKLEAAISKLNILERCNQRMHQLIGDLLDLSRVGRVEVDYQIIDTSKYISGIIDSLETELNRKNITSSISEPLPMFEGNESRVLQVFENIISNAIKYTQDDGTGKIEIGGHTDGNWTQIYIKDNGPGIEEQYHEKVFSLFQRLESNQEGTGVGLAIVQKIMKFHHGKVWIESKGQGTGCTFWLRFPNSQPKQQKEHGQ